MSLQDMKPLPNKVQKARYLKAARAVVKALESMPDLTPCAECLMFQSGFCDHWKATVPESEQLKGCEAWDEQIPF